MAVPIEELEGLLAARFPGGTMTIEAWENHLFCDVMGVKPDGGGSAHPAFLFHKTLAGAGYSVAQMIADGRPESPAAVRGGGYRWELKRALRVGEPYAVTGGWVGVERKRGGRAGLMDVMTYRLDLHDAAGELVATTWNRTLFLRTADDA